MTLRFYKNIKNTKSINPTNYHQKTLLNNDEMAPYPPDSHPTTAVSDIELFRAYQESLRSYTERFKFNDRKEKIEQLYTFCRGMDVQDPGEENDHTDRKPINYSRDVAINWLKTEFKKFESNKRSDRPHANFIIGDVWVGKSSFLKYMFRVEESCFRDNKIIPCRV